MQYRIVIHSLLTNRITPLTKYFDSREYALQRMQESYTSNNGKFIYDLQSKEQARKLGMQ